MKELKGYLDCNIFYLDSYRNSHGYEEIKNIIEKNKDQFNIIATSLGPKPSAISLFKLAMEFNQIGLVYTPSKDFNKLYSSGFSQLGEIHKYERTNNENSSCNI
jgi:hypothetical protein